MSKTTDTPTVTIKNYRECEGMDGIAWSGTIYVDGKKAAFARNSGSGGPNDYDWSPSSKKNQWGGPVHDRLVAYVKTLPPLPPHPVYGGNPLPMDLDLFLEELIGDMQENKQVRRWCKANKCLVYRTSDMEQGQWYKTSDANSLANRKRAIAEFLSKTVEFANDRFWAPPKAA
jgi:hypothetical protein